MTPMLDIIGIVAPVFALIAIGWASARSGYVSAGAGKAVAEFAFKVAMPALLFRAMLNLGELQGTPWKLVAAFFGAIGTVWILATLATRLLLRRPAEDAASIAMGATFGNTVMLGIPLALNAFGPEAAAPIALLISLDTPVLWIAATLQMEAARRTGAGGFAALKGVVVDILKNPIVMSLALGTLARLGGLVLPAIPEKIVSMMANAAVPAALFALGTSLAAFEIKGQRGTLSLILILKMLVFPVAAYALARTLELPPVWVGIVTLFGAMPVGANAYLFASRYDRAVNSVSGSIAVSTALAVLSVTAVLALLRTGVI